VSGGGARSYDGETAYSINRSILSSYKHTVQYIKGDVTSKHGIPHSVQSFSPVYPEKAAIR
jgi:hypothetical protein